MKKSSFLTFGLVLVIFAGIQGWMLYRLFIAPRVFRATEAVIMGETTEIRVPSQGIVRKVMVKENDVVIENQTLFTLTRIVADPLAQQSYQDDTDVLAPAPGIVSQLSVRNGIFVQAAQKVAMIVDNSPNALYVSAKIRVPPADVPRIQARMAARVQANFLFDGSPVDATVSTVEPQYDAKTQLLTARLTLLRYPDGIENLPLGLPVEAWVEEVRRPTDNVIISLFHMLFPGTLAGTE